MKQYYPIIPILRLPRTLPASFTYSSEASLHRGALVRVPFRGKEVYGIVASKEVDRYRSFRVLSVKKIENYSLPDWYCTFVERLPVSMFEHPGTILKAVLNKVAWRKLASAPALNSLHTVDRRRATRTSRVTLAPYSCSEERLSFLSRSIAESHKRKRSLLIMIPSFPDAQRIFHMLQREFSELIFIHGATPSSRMTAALLSEKFRLILTTRIGVFLPVRFDVIICDDEPNPLYQQREPAPTYDAREIARIRVTCSGERLVFAGYSLRFNNSTIANYHRIGIPPLWVDMKHVAHSEFLLISESVREKISQVPLLFLTSGKFFSRRVSCAVCGLVFQCPNCDRPYQAVDEHALLCPSCGKRDSMPPFCSACSGTKFFYPRIGAPQVKIRLRSLLDTSAAFDVCALSEVDRLELSQFHTIVIVSLDTLMTHEFNSFENLAHSLIKLQKIFHGQLVIQYRSEQLREQVSNLKSAFTSDLETRRKLSYPPFGDLYTIRYSPRSKKHLSENEAKKLIAGLISVIDEHIVSWSTKKRGLPYMTFNVKLAKGHPFDWKKLPQDFHIFKY